MGDGEKETHAVFQRPVSHTYSLRVELTLYWSTLFCLISSGLSIKYHSVVYCSMNIGLNLTNCNATCCMSLGDEVQVLDFLSKLNVIHYSQLFKLFGAVT